MEAKRRDKGEGSIYQRKDGKWVAKFKPQNHASTKYFYGKTEKEVKKKLKEFQVELIKNNYIEVQKRTVREYMDYWFYNIKIHELKPKSFDRSESTLINHIYPYIGDLQISGLTANDIQMMINELVKRDLSYSSIHRAYVTINNCFKLGVIKEEVTRNPCVGVMLPLNKKKMVTSIRCFTDDEVKKICKESIRTYSNGTKVYRLGNVIILLLYTGMRIGECLGLKWSDIDFEKKLITIHGNVVVVKNREEDAETKFQVKYQDSPKTISGNRVIYLNQKAIMLS